MHHRSPLFYRSTTPPASSAVRRTRTPALCRASPPFKKGHDFVFKGHRYQVKGNRPSGKPGSFVTWVPKATNYNWDYLIWVLYDSRYQIQKAWQWEVSAYRDAFDCIKRLSPAHLRLGKQLA